MMKDSNTKTLVILLILTLVVGFLSGIEEGRNKWFMLILGVSSIKFLLVAFQFMDLKKAHVAWKIALSIYLLFFFSAISIVLN